MIRLLTLALLLLAAPAFADGPVVAQATCRVDLLLPTTNADGTPLTDLKEVRLYMDDAPAPTATPIVVLTTPASPTPGSVVSWPCGISPRTYYIQVEAADFTGNVSTRTAQCAFEISNLSPLPAPTTGPIPGCATGALPPGPDTLAPSMPGVRVR